MPKVSRESAANVNDQGPVEDWSEDVEGYTINFLKCRQDVDGAPMLKGLPDDRCQCPHWGYVFKGRLTYRFADREEVFQTGDAFYVPPGHVSLFDAGSEFVQFSPSDELQVVSATIQKNMRAMQSV